MSKKRKKGRGWKHPKTGEIWSSTDSERIKQVISAQEYVVLAIDGMQPDVGHEVLWVIRDCISQEILLAKTILFHYLREAAKPIYEADRHPKKILKIKSYD